MYFHDFVRRKIGGIVSPYMAVFAMPDLRRGLMATVPKAQKRLTW